MRDAGFPPISTVGNPTITTPPCAVCEVMVQAGIPIGYLPCFFRSLRL